MTRITFSIETVDQILPDMMPLFPEHWAELALYQDKIALKPDFNFYYVAEDIGRLACFAVRDGKALVGYAVYLIQPSHHHYMDNSWAVSDLFWIKPEYRRAYIGTGLFDMIEKELLATRKIDVMHTGVKESLPGSAYFLAARGHDKVETFFSKRL